MTSPKGRILCTEDDTDTRDLIIFLLQNEGYEVICTGTAKQAISLAKEQSFDLYLVDSWLPNSSGSMLTRKIREFDTKTPILFYSAAAYEADKENARSAGAQSYLVKPAENEKLVAEVIRLIGANQTLQDLPASFEKH
jgi:DNA-binding response OmpR family regulator